MRHKTNRELYEQLEAMSPDRTAKTQPGSGAASGSEAHRKEMLNAALDDIGLALEKFGKTFGTGTGAKYLAREELKDARDFLKAVLPNDGTQRPGTPVTKITK